MSIHTLVFSYLLGGVTFIPLLVFGALFYTYYTSIPVGDTHPHIRRHIEQDLTDKNNETEATQERNTDTDDTPKIKKGWLTVRRTFEESSSDGSYVNLMRSFLDARSKDYKKSKPKDMWYVALKGKVLFLYEDESMTDCEGAIELGSHNVVIYPEQLPDGELFTKRNAICLKPKHTGRKGGMPSVTKEMKLESDVKVDPSNLDDTKKNAKAKQGLKEMERQHNAAREQANSIHTPWFIFVRSVSEMEDWYLALIHASDNRPLQPTLEPLRDVFRCTDMEHLVQTLDEQPDVIPMRWFNAIIGRIFFSYYRTRVLEENIIGRLMKKISKVKFPAFLSDILVTEVSLGNRAPMLSKPMLKELTKEGEASMEVHVAYKGEIRITIQATATINLGARFKPYTVKLVLAAVLKELEGNLLIKVKRPPSSRIWYGFTQMPRMVLAVEPIVSERQITWTMILSTIESKLKEIIQESVVLPNMDDISYFDSEDYCRRGGIWSDAKRTDRLTTSFPDTPAATVSAPVRIETNESLSEPSSPEAISRNPSSNPEQNDPSSPKVAETTEVKLPEAEYVSESPPSDIKRKSWFAPSEDGTDKSDSGSPRRRTLSALFAPAASSRSSSVSTQLESDSSDGELVRDESELTIRRTPSPLAESLPDNGKRRASPTLSAQSSPNVTNGTSSTSSFLANLKTRADTQALENSAKEAMRKWGVNFNWGGRKDAKSEDDNVSDQGSVGPTKVSERLQAMSVKTRSSYADLRAAVAERKERNEAASSPLAAQAEFTKPAADAPQHGLVAPKLEGSTSTSSRSDDKPSSYTDERGMAFEEEAHKPRIAVQPQAMTMSIPGIHAAHRGEVQSLGHVAAEPEPTSATKNMSPTMQTVYRLLARPQTSTPAPPTPPPSMITTTSSLDSTSTEADTSTLTDETGPVESSEVGGLEADEKSTETNTRPKPPPLPPRNSVAVVASGGVIGSPPNTPSASETLKTIVERTRNVSNGPPPLPPRPSAPVGA